MSQHSKNRDSRKIHTLQKTETSFNHENKGSNDVTKHFDSLRGNQTTHPTGSSSNRSQRAYRIYIIAALIFGAVMLIYSMIQSIIAVH